jgi:hypothetical protein
MLLRHVIANAGEGDKLMVSKATGSARQARFKAKMQGGGYKQANLWLPVDRLEEMRAFAQVLRIHPDAKIVATVNVPQLPEPGLRDAVLTAVGELDDTELVQVAAALKQIVTA